ncbi:MAG TPA: stage III sporulation protein AA [Ruminococcaceae bacterium]|nr:stage III sporulation protein AA [Oscillospiraceae bacterium]
MDEKSAFDQAVECTGNRLQTFLLALPQDVKSRAQEIRLRCNRPLLVRLPNSDITFNGSGRMSYLPSASPLLVRAEDVEECFHRVCGFSVHTHSRDICNGFVTVEGGHRVGAVGTAACADGKITAIREISSLNIRIAREHRGCADKLFEHIRNSGFRSFLLAGPPCTGKTTVLRDLTRLLGGVSGKSTALLDERGEIAGCVNGCPQKDIGRCCDVLTGYPKSQAVTIALRSLSPDFVVTDEVSRMSEVEAMENGFHSGVSFFLSVHAHSEEDLMRKQTVRRLLESGMFGEVAFLSDRNHPGVIQYYRLAGELLDTGYRSDDALTFGRADWCADGFSAKASDSTAYAVR